MYSKISKVLHWMVSSMLVMMLSLGFFLESVPTSFRATAYTLHKSCGLTILILMVLRIASLLYFGRPILPKRMARMERILLRSVQYALYVFLIAMPLSGWILSTASGHIPEYFGLFSLPMPGIVLNKVLAGQMSSFHTVIAWCLIVLSASHIASMLKRQLINKDHFIRRMLF